MKIPALALVVACLLFSSLAPSHLLLAQPIFDGVSLDGWTATNGDPVPDGWQVEDGTIHLNAARENGGNIVTAQEYGDFILDFEWKIASGGNSGIKYRVQRFGSRLLGCEFQILDDDGHRDGTAAKTSAGSLYDLYPPTANKYVRPVGEFNQSRIVICGHHLEHWLNGQLIVSADVGSDTWWVNKAGSKFADTEYFGEHRFGRIMLTDHNSDVWYRSIQLTPLTGCWLVESSRAVALTQRCPRPRLFRHRFLRRR